ncbi:MAG: hypothetical protein QF903_10885 [Planctomycetota bacterium]|nr:hypothetical protein [Planctomycetota bacterium]MDP6762665.1 hypothetical protein [Planctomycetota bacterium]MDP6989974.1 hypothetical protein [Planctomycetota bacterium]
MNETWNAQRAGGEEPAGSLDELDLRARGLEREGANVTRGLGGEDHPGVRPREPEGSLERDLAECERLLADCRREWAAARGEA